MLEIRIGGIPVRVSLLFPAAVVVLLTLDTAGTAGWCLAASAMHEAGHFLLLLAFGCRPACIHMGIFGVRVEQNGSRPLSYGRNVLVSLAGPAVNLITFTVLYLAGGWTVPAAVHFVLGVFNLLPIEPLDGGQALFCLLALFVSERTANRVVMAVSVLVLFPLGVAGWMVMLGSRYNFSLLAVCVYLFLLILLKADPQRGRQCLRPKRGTASRCA